MASDSGDPIARAKARLAEWHGLQEQHHAETRFNRCTPAELIRIAEANCDLDGRPLRGGDDIVALDEAWFAAFGELFCQPVGADDVCQWSASEPAPVIAAPLDQHPLLSVPDDAMLRPRDVHRLFGYARSTLKPKFPEVRKQSSCVINLP